MKGAATSTTTETQRGLSAATKAVRSTSITRVLDHFLSNHNFVLVRVAVRVLSWINCFLIKPIERQRQTQPCSFDYSLFACPTVEESLVPYVFGKLAKAGDLEVLSNLERQHGGRKARTVLSDNQVSRPMTPSPLPLSRLVFPSQGLTPTTRCDVGRMVGRLTTPRLNPPPEPQEEDR